jgi:hypothetical protein
MRPSLKASLPALTTLSLSLSVMAVEQGFQVSAPRTFDVTAGRYSTAIVLNVGLLAALPFIGAAGASVAKWLGHSRKAAVESVMSPVGLVAAMLLTLALFDLATTRFVVSSLAYSSGILLGWVLAPAAALLLGCYVGWKLTPLRPWYLRCC